MLVFSIILAIAIVGTALNVFGYYRYRKYETLLRDLFIEYRWFYFSARRLIVLIPDKTRIVSNAAEAKEYIRGANVATKKRMNIFAPKHVYLKHKRMVEKNATPEQIKDRMVKEMLEESTNVLRGQIGSKYGFDSQIFLMSMKTDSLEKLGRIKRNGKW